MLEMKAKCEKCEKELGWEDDVRICSYECTWCQECGAAMNDICPNCGGELLARPRRKVPAST